MFLVRPEYVRPSINQKSDASRFSWGVNSNLTWVSVGTTWLWNLAKSSLSAFSGRCVAERCFGTSPFLYGSLHFSRLRSRSWHRICPPKLTVSGYIITYSMEVFLITLKYAPPSAFQTFLLRVKKVNKNCCQEKWLLLPSYSSSGRIEITSGMKAVEN